MKKTLSLLSLATLLVTFAGAAHAENLFVVNESNNTDSLFVTVTETSKETGEEKVKDTQCLQRNSSAYFSNFDAKNKYTVKAEAKNGWCDGKAVNTFVKGVDFGGSDLQATINDYGIEVRGR